MNYQNLNDESKEYSAYFRYWDNVLSKFSNFFKEFSKSGNKFATKVKKLIEDISTEMDKEEYFINTLDKNLKSFCKQYKEMIDTLITFFNNIEKDFVDKITEFDKEYKTNYKNYTTKLDDLNSLLFGSKTKLEKAKNAYFDSCKGISDFIKSNLPKEGEKEEENNKIKEQIDKMKKTSEAKKVSYRLEVTTLNDLLFSNEVNYTKILDLILKQEENKGKFYANTLTSFNNSINELKSSIDKALEKTKKYLDEIHPKRDIKMFSLYFNRNNNKERTRFLFEEFLDYENINDFGDKKNNKDNKVSNNNDNSIEKDIKEINKIDLDFAKKIMNLGTQYFIDMEDAENNLIEIDIINFNMIIRDEKIDSEKFLQIINYIDEKPEGCKKYIYILFRHYITKSMVKFNNVENLHLLNTILNMIINFIWNKDDYSFLALLILYIGERTIYYKDEDKYPTHYLCKIMSKNTLYNSIDFWNKIINLNIKIWAKVKLNEEFIYRKKNSSSKKGIGIMSKLFWGKDDNKQKMEDDILYSQIYKEKSTTYCTEILTEFISHFINYNFMGKDTKTLVELFSSQYYLNVRQINYFKEMLSSNEMCIKSSNPYFNDYKYALIMNKINSKDLNDISHKKLKNSEKNKIIQNISFSFKYLTNKDIINILCLNKEFHFKLKKTFYKNILIKHTDLDIKHHIFIWKQILDYNNIKKKYNFKKLKESINDNVGKSRFYEIIELDTIRTTFEVNTKENRDKLTVILKLISKELPTVNYCQGMNQIAAFLLILCNEDEEEAFYLFLSILFHTDYCGLINNDLLQLNSFFYCFERLLNIMFPEMYNYLKSVNISVNYFLSPWFITIFTNAFFYDKEKNNNIKIIVRIFDIFIFSGWKAIFKIGISLIKNYSAKSFTLNYEKLVNYLNNELIRTTFFKNENINEIMNVWINLKISKKLINKLCKEYDMKKTILNKTN